jgi:hypothetical protein
MFLKTSGAETGVISWYEKPQMWKLELTLVRRNLRCGNWG